jgi:hypothetical protein
VLWISWKASFTLLKHGIDHVKAKASNLFSQFQDSSHSSVLRGTIDRRQSYVFRNPNAGLGEVFVGVLGKNSGGEQDIGFCFLYGIDQIFLG